MAAARRFSGPTLEELAEAKILGVRAGAEHRYTGAAPRRHHVGATARAAGAGAGSVQLGSPHRSRPEGDSEVAAWPGK